MSYKNRKLRRQACLAVVIVCYYCRSSTNGLETAFPRRRFRGKPPCHWRLRFLTILNGDVFAECASVQLCAQVTCSDSSRRNAEVEGTRQGRKRRHEQKQLTARAECAGGSSFSYNCHGLLFSTLCAALVYALRVSLDA